MIVSTDYWCAPIVPAGLYDDLYKCPVTIFTEATFRPYLAAARAAGFEVDERIDFSCGAPVVHWKRLDLRFTFLFMAFRLRPEEA